MSQSETFSSPRDAVVVRPSVAEVYFMDESFGRRLRQRREQQQIALATIAERTKIKQSLLEGLERDDFSHWPSGIFRRAYIRSYASAIGLCPDATVREFLALYPDPDDTAGLTGALASAAERGNGGPPSRLRFIVGSAIESLSRLRRSETGTETHVEFQRVEAPLETESAPTRHPDPPLVNHETERSVATAGHVPAAPPVAPAPPPPALQLVVPTPPAPDFLALAELCTNLGRVDAADVVPPLLKECAEILDATGLIVWLWDATNDELIPALAHGYPEAILAHVPAVRHDADNATAAAFRSGRACTIAGDESARGALVIPMLTASGCAGVLALELQHGGERSDAVRAAATIVAASLAQMIGGGRPAEQDTAEQARAVAM